jgi:hypothetical protein
MDWLIEKIGQVLLLVASVSVLVMVLSLLTFLVITLFQLATV